MQDISIFRSGNAKMSANADRKVDSNARQIYPAVSRIMTKLRFALVLLFSAGIGVIADIPVGNGGESYPGTEPRNTSTVQQWSGPQRSGSNPQQTGNAYNSEDYDGEQYQDNRIRLMLHPKNTITLNETNLRTWKTNPASYQSQLGVTEPFLAVRRAFPEEETKPQPQVTTQSNSTTGKHPTKVGQTVSDSLANVNSFASQPTGRPTNLEPTKQLESKPNVTAFTATWGDGSAVAYVDNGDSSKTNASGTTVQMISNISKVTFGKETPPPIAGADKVKKKSTAYDNSTEAAYVDIETDGDYDEELGVEQQYDVPDMPESNSYVIVLPGSKGKYSSEANNISSVKPEVISDSLLYLLSNLTASSAMSERYEKRILKELAKQKIRINDVDAKISNIYELLKKPN